jgi:hypothetical protein
MDQSIRASLTASRAGWRTTWSERRSSFFTPQPGEPCGDALEAHFGAGPVIDVDSPGLDAPGDSLLFFAGESISAKISAAAGSTLFYLCAIHPWMQGSIIVR